MLEANAHNQLKTFLEGISSEWPHHLTFSRIVARSLRRRDHTLIHLDTWSQNCWWPGLLIPLSIDASSAVLILSDNQRSRFFKQELPRLKEAGLELPLWEGSTPPETGQVWLLNTYELIEAYHKGHLSSRQLIFPEVEFLSRSLRHALSIQISSSDWEVLRRAYPGAEKKLISFYETLSLQCFSRAAHLRPRSTISKGDIFVLKEILKGLGNIPLPWSHLTKVDSDRWASWADLDHKLLNWVWNFQPLEPFQVLNDLFHNYPVILLSSAGNNSLFTSELKAINFSPNVELSLSHQKVVEPLSLFAPVKQPLPNTEIFASHLLDQCLRLILGRSGLTVLLLDDEQLLRALTAQLAAEFGRRVSYETTAPEINGVLSCSSSWWLKHHDQLPVPEQLVIAMLPIASLECPLTAARVAGMKSHGRDWFRDFLLPESLLVLSEAIEPVRRGNGRLAILDGRLFRRSWGKEVLRTLEPWTPLNSLLP